jgi:hypothetical protein
MLTDENLVLERPHDIGNGVQRVYRSKSGYGLSAVNPQILRSYPFAWEIAVLKDVSKDGKEFTLDYSTPLTSDVEVFSSDEEANEFIHRAAVELG